MIAVLRLGHRVGRDDRISTHCGLVSRALGADAIVYSGDRDMNMVEGVTKVTNQFGGSFEASYNPNWKKVVDEFKRRKFTVVHLTAYGMPLQQKIIEIRKRTNVLVVVGGEKVPGEMYGLADYNISVASQPHSEIAALALFLHEYFEGKELGKDFNGKIKIIPQEHGKKVVED